MFYLTWLIIGFILGVVLLFYARSHSPRGEKRILTIGLFIAALIYIDFALLWGDTYWLTIETMGVLAFGIFAWLATRYTVHWLAIGWGLHPLWDVPLHLMGPGRAVAPAWYAVACISFDLLIAVYILFNSDKYDTGT